MLFNYFNNGDNVKQNLNSAIRRFLFSFAKVEDSSR